MVECEIGPSPYGGGGLPWCRAHQQTETACGNLRKLESAQEVARICTDANKNMSDEVRRLTNDLQCANLQVDVLRKVISSQERMLSGRACCEGYGTHGDAHSFNCGFVVKRVCEHGDWIPVAGHALRCGKCNAYERINLA